MGYDEGLTHFWDGVDELGCRPLLWHEKTQLGIETQIRTRAKVHVSLEWAKVRSGTLAVCCRPAKRGRGEGRVEAKLWASNKQSKQEEEIG